MFDSYDDARILDAARDGDLKTLRQIASRAGHIEEFRRKCEVLTNGKEGRRALHIAAEFGRTEICKFLIEEVSVDIDLKTDHGITSLPLAIDHGRDHTAMYLINRGADITITDSEGMTSFHHAVREGNLKLTEFLLYKGANIEAKSVHGTPLQIATWHGNADLVSFLLFHHAMPNSETELVTCPLMLALRVNSPASVGFLLRVEADPNVCSFISTPLAYAASQGVQEYVWVLLDSGADPNRKDELELVPIEYAGYANNQEAVKLLFPVSQRIKGCADWSVDGIIQYLHSEEGRIKRICAISVRLWEYKERGRHAMMTGNFKAGVKWYSKAISLDSSNTLLKLYRSICFSHLNEAAFALFDAKTCSEAKPYSTRAHYRVGLAWWQLGNGLHCISRGLDLKHRAIKHAWKASTVVSLCEMYSKYPMEVISHLARASLMGLPSCILAGLMS